MKFILRIDNQTYSLSEPPIDISVPMLFNGRQPNTYGVPHATAKAFEGEGFVGDVRRGGSCNFETYNLTPHCNGTHTECLGHITFERVAVHSVLQRSIFAATVVSVLPVSPLQTYDSYRPAPHPEDKLITRELLEATLQGPATSWTEALIIRTLPNSPTKKARNYLEEPPAYFSLEAMEYIRSLEVQHLLTDLPSIDRMFDEGHMDNHHIFWSMPKDSHEVPSAEGRARTITEMIFVPDEVEDGRVILELQIAPWMCDAAPSRPRIWQVENKIIPDEEIGTK